MTNTPKTTYNQPPLPPQGQMVQPGLMPPGLMPPGAVPPPPPMRKRPAPRGWRERWMRRFGMDTTVPLQKGALTVPDWLTKYATVTYVFALAIVTIIYSSYSLPWYYMLSGIVSVLLFFGYGQTLTQRLSETRVRHQKNFEKRIFWIAFIPRVTWMFLIYIIFMQNYGDPFGFDNADAVYYDQLGQFVANLMIDGNFHFYDEISAWSGNDDIADMGYGVYVGLIYLLTGSGDLLSRVLMSGAEVITNPISIIALRVIKCVLSSLTVLLIYKLTKRNFEDKTARLAAIFCALWPNFWYYCGCHLKEVEMVFLAVLFVEQADQMLRSRQFTAWKVIPVLLIAAAIFTVRTPLALVAILALLFSIAMSSTKVVSWGKRIVVGTFAVLLIGITVGNRIEERARRLVEQVQAGGQDTANEWRTRRENGNAFAKYAGTAVFAPMIFTIPFPTMVRPFEGQEVQQLLNGGNFVKNIVSGITILALIVLLLSGKWRDHLLPLSFMLGYLVVLTMSAFAHSERFHQPVMPFELMFAAYGMSIVLTKRKYKHWFGYWFALMFIAAIAWNWFKMTGRGL